MSHTEQRQARESDVTDAQRSAYWRERLADRPPALDLPVSQVAPPSLAEGRRQRTPFSLAGSRQRGFAAFLEREGYDAIEGLLAAWVALLFRTTRQDDLLVGVHENGRYGAVRVQFAERTSYRELLRRTAARLAEAREHALPLPALLAATRCTRPDALFQTLFSVDAIDASEDMVVGHQIAQRSRHHQLGLTPRLAPQHPAPPVSLQSRANQSGAAFSTAPGFIG